MATKSESNNNGKNKNGLYEKEFENLQLDEEDGINFASLSLTQELNDMDLENVPDLEQSIIEARDILHKFLRNQFDEAIEDSNKFESSSLYYSLIKSYMMYFYACLTLERPEIDAGKEQLVRSLAFCQKMRKHHSLINSFTSFIWKPNYNEYTDMEIHAELVYAELLTFQTFLSFLSDQNLIALIRGAFRMRSAHAAYRTCLEIVSTRTKWGSDFIRQEFEAGTSLGNGVIQLLLSHLPTKLLKLLSMVGYYGDQEFALRELQKTTNEYRNSARYKIADQIICIYNLYAQQMFGAGEGDIDWAERLIKIELEEFPGGCITLFHGGRLNSVKGDPKKAIEYFQQCIEVPKSWRNIDNICYWDMCWCYAIQCDWKNAAKCAMQLKTNCNWSPATNQYQYACFKAMELEEDPDNQDLKTEVMHAMEAVPQLKVRYAGKTIPPEKYACTMATRFTKGEKDMILPALELFYVWNIFAYASSTPELIQRLLDMIEPKLVKERTKTFDHTTALDTYCYLTLMKGVCLRAINRFNEAVNCFKEVLKYEMRCQVDTYLPPHAAFELGAAYWGANDLDNAKIWLEKSRSDYSGFLIETMIHLRVHGALSSIKRQEKANRRPSKFGKLFKS